MIKPFEMSLKTSQRVLFLRKRGQFTPKKAKKHLKMPPAVAYRGTFFKKKYAVKEPDPETGLYYYGARYLDPKTSRWLSGDPALGEYLPVAPLGDEEKKRNQNLPGMGGVFNTVNMHVYHYAGNNPVKYTDPDGETDRLQLASGIFQTAGGVLIMVVSVGAAAETGGASFLIFAWGAKEFMDGIDKIVLAFSDTKYNGMLPTAVGLIAKAAGADETTRRRIEAGIGTGESFIGMVSATKVPEFLLSLGAFGLSGAELINTLFPSSGESNSSSSNNTTFQGRYNSVFEKYVRYLSAVNANTSPSHYDRLTINQYKSGLLGEINGLIDETFSLDVKLELDAMRRVLNGIE
jgi:RHS repeat-associated protein